jgi:hypothetical protein
MDWIERWFDFSPDNGDGSLELLVFVALAIVVSWLLVSVSGRLRARMQFVVGRCRAHARSAAETAGRALRSKHDRPMDT